MPLFIWEHKDGIMEDIRQKQILGFLDALRNQTLHAHLNSNLSYPNSFLIMVDDKTQLIINGIIENNLQEQIEKLENELITIYKGENNEIWKTHTES
jgi:hypothetical protein